MERLFRKNLVKKFVNGIFFRGYCLCDYIICKSIFCIIRANAKKRFEKLKFLKNSYMDKRIFIIGTGPSLQVDDVKKLKNEYTMGLNSFVTGIKEFGYEPSFYGFTDVEVVNDIWTKEVMALSKSIVFMPTRRWYNPKVKKALLDKQNVVEYPMIEGHQWMNFAKKVPKDFSKDASREVYFGYTCAYAMLQLAVYMGFKEIYLLGMDCNYPANVQCFGEVRDQDKIKAGSNAGQYFMIAWEEAKKYCDANGIKIYNATRGGKLEVFPRVNFDEITSNK